MHRMPVVVDLRAGNQIQLYEGRSFVYRTLLRTLLRSASAVTYEGEKYDGFIADLAPEAPRQLLPNFVATALPRMKDMPFEKRAPVMIYVGQLSESKGVPKALEVFREIRRHEPEARFYLVGAVTGGRSRLLELNSEANQGVILTGPLPFDKIIPLLDAGDFFMFITQFPGEGHSNALTEAMARGCVPVCTQHGFNSEVIGHSGITVEVDAAADAVAARILACWRSGEWQNMSHEAVHRVRSYFTQEAVAAAIDATYRALNDKSAENGAVKQEASSCNEETEAHTIK
jgi:glycosyltransferase involved in cell wall biosynthesis